MIYNATPTARKFHLDESLVRLLLGPVGCGKSLACCLEIVRIMHVQKKQKDGFRRSKHVVIRETYPALKSTTLATWKELFPTPETGRLVMDTPIIHYFELGDVRAEVVFISIETEADIKKLMSLEATTIWINEARYSLREILRIALQRVGRYPASKHAECIQPCVILDTNPCDDDHWIYNLFEVQKPESYSIFKYPPAILKDENGIWVPNPDAENIQNLKEGYKYYLKQTLGNNDEWINVYLCGEYGTSYDGRRVYPEYKDRTHCIPGLKGNPDYPIYLGFDFGLTPACVIAQLLPNGQLLALDEVTTDFMGLTNFLKVGVNPFLAQHYANFKIGGCVGDPAGRSRSGLNESQTSFTILKDNGIDAMPAKTNDIMPRIEAVSRRLSLMIDGEPALLISDRCPNLRKGFNGGYHFQKINVAIGKDETKYKEVPNKNKYSHPHDAFQYICLDFDTFQAATPKNSQEANKMLSDLGFLSPGQLSF